MIFGTIPFYCNECGNRFMGVAAEWCATAFVSPVKCPKCGGWHTRPWSLLPAAIANKKYQPIWDKIDKHNE